MAKFETNHPTDMRNINYHVINQYLLYNGPGGSFTEQELVFKLGYVDEGNTTTVAGSFDYTVNAEALELVSFEGTVTGFTYAWHLDYYDIDLNGNETLVRYRGSFTLSDFSLNADYFLGNQTNGEVAAVVFQGDDEISGFSGVDYLLGYGGADTLSGKYGNDTLDGGTGDDTMFGGFGDDLYLVDSVHDLAIEYPSAGNDTVKSSANYRLGSYLENLTLTGRGNINGTGNDLSNRLIGNSGENKLSGGSGNDIINGGAGADIMQGDSGDDTYYVDNAGDLIVEKSSDGTLDWVGTSVSYTLSGSAYVEKLTTTSSSGTNAIDLTGNSIAQAIIGNAGDNKINGKGGADTMIGHGGNDTYYVDNAGDIVVEKVTGGTFDWVGASVSYALSTSAYVEKLSTTSVAGTAAIDLTGNNIAQVIVGNAGHNKINGKGGADTMIGHGGNDTYYVDNAGDIIVEKVTGGTFDWVGASVSYVLSTSAYVEKLSTTSVAGTAAIDLTGNSIAQTIIGNAGENILNGRGGNDTLTGGKGDDTFLFDTALSTAKNVDTITDYRVGTDTIHLDQTVFATLRGLGTLAVGAFVSNSTGQASENDDRIIYNKLTGELYYDANGSAVGGRVHFANLTVDLNLTNNDFFVV